MRVFVTGATGFIGSEITRELLEAGHQVLGLTRSDAGAQTLAGAGAEVHRGDLNDLESLRSGAAMSDGVIHTAFNHDFSTFVANCEMDRRAIETLGSALLGSDRPLLITSGTGMGRSKPGRLATENDAPDPDNHNPRVASELAAAAVQERGVNVSVMRLPQVHNEFKQGLISYAVAIALEKGVSAYIGDGSNRWPAVHVRDAARLYRLALEKRQVGTRYNAVAEEGISVRDIAESIGRGLRVPTVSLTAEEAGPHFGWLAPFAAMDLPASSALTREWTGWQPTGPVLLVDLERLKYPRASSTAIM